MPDAPRQKLPSLRNLQAGYRSVPLRRRRDFTFEALPPWALKIGLGARAAMASTQSLHRSPAWNAARKSNNNNEIRQKLRCAPWRETLRPLWPQLVRAAIVGVPGTCAHCGIASDGAERAALRPRVDFPKALTIFARGCRRAERRRAPRVAAGKYTHPLQ